MGCGSGCDTGFGNLCARRLDALGVTVFAGCLFPGGTDAADLSASSSSKLQIVPLDVTSDQQVDDAVDYVTRNLREQDNKRL
ncbi:hypothetical protein PR048_015245 [Dryococelus australis]|uniref:Uncharacterized protein n=1 Tax=Dryococelus australis TaxID=614101 RepID=A0ABQ9HGN8_9NEOP|nr:hypothetical protein PR048_015245 [Dryococelus australis]